MVTFGGQNHGEALAHAREHPLVLRALRYPAEQLLQDDAGDGDLAFTFEQGGDSSRQRHLPLALSPPPEHCRNDARVEQDHGRRAFL